MKTFRRLMAGLLTALFLSVASIGHAINWMNPADTLQDGQFGLNIVDDFVNNGTQISKLYAHEMDPSGLSNQYLCDDLDDVDCQYGAHDVVMGTLLLPACEQVGTWDCIMSLEVSSDGSEFVLAEYLGETSGPTYSGSTAKGFPEARTISRWNAQSVANNSGTTTYAVKATLDANLSSSGKYHLSRLNVSVLPYREKSGSYRELGLDEHIGEDGIQRVGSAAPPAECAWVTTSACGEMVDFAESQVVRVVLKVSNSLGGWLFGRITNPVVAIDQVDSNYSLVSVTGSPLIVAKAFAAVSIANPGPKAAKILERIPAQSRQGKGISNTQASYLPTEWLEAIRETTNDTSVANYQAWNFGSISGSAGGCIKPGTGMGGLVTTNSTIYQPTAPSLENGTLKYKVAGLHYQSDGVTPVIGSYDLVIRKDVAKCIYGFTETPTSATVAISSENGELNVATSILRDAGDWIALEARGFTFSEKTIAVGMGAIKPIKATITAFKGSSKTLSWSQKTQISKAVNAAKGITKLVCTGVYVNPKDAAMAKLRAKAACQFGQTKNRKLGIWYQAKKTKSASYAGKVILSSK